MLIRRLEVEGRPIAALVYFDGMTDKTAVSEFIVKPLLQRPEQLLGKTTEQIAAACCMLPIGKLLIMTRIL